MVRVALGFLAFAILVGPGSAAPIPKGTKPAVGETNTNAP